MSTDNYDSSKSNNSFEDAKKGARESANDFKRGVDDLVNSTDNKKMLAGLLGIFFGGLGIHKFILGYTQEGLILLGIFLISFPLMCLLIGAFTMYIPILIGFIEGIIYLTKSDEEFYQTYQVGRRPRF